MITKTIISGPEALKEFRDLWTGLKILSLLKKHDGKLLITWPVGTGKSYNIDNVIGTGIYENVYDLIIALMPTTAVLQERQWVINPPDDIKIEILRPRPAEMCGQINDELWQVFEQNSMGTLGRFLLCKHCKNYQNCFWPNQYGKNLKNAKVIFGNQVHLQRNPQFVSQLKVWSGAHKILIVIDESNFVTKDMTRKITQDQLECYLEILQNYE